MSIWITVVGLYVFDLLKLFILNRITLVALILFHLKERLVRVIRSVFHVHLMGCMFLIQRIDSLESFVPNRLALVALFLIQLKELIY